MGINKIVRDTFIIAWIKSYPDFRRNPLLLMVLAMISAIPLFFMLMLSNGENTIVQGLIGAMISSVGFAAINAGIQDISWDRYVKIREMIVAMPVHPVSYAFGIALAPLLISVPSLLFFGALIAYLGYMPLGALMWIVVSLIMAWAAASTMGFMISTYLYKSSQIALNNLANLLGIGFVFIPPVYYSEAQLGGMSWISLLIPTSNAAGMIRSYMGLLPVSAGMMAIRWLSLIATTAVFVLLTCVRARWREK